MFDRIFSVKPLLSDENINTILLRITCLFWLIAKLIGWKMYTTYRLFPTAPIFGWLDNVPSSVHTVLFLLSVLLIIILFIKPVNKYFLIGLLAADLLLCLPDQNRWQPWEYQYLFIIFIFIANVNRQKIIPVAVSFLLAFTYIYSGLGKLNMGFLETTWTTTILKHFFRAPASIANNHWLYFAGYGVGSIELIAGIGLLFSKTKKTSAVVLILMHVFVLLLLGPLGLRFNKVIWPWNLAMILYLYVIFVKKNDIAITFRPLIAGWNLLVILCWGILPSLNFIGYWDNYLSLSMYSGKIPKMIVCVSDTGNCKPLSGFFYKSNATKICSGEMKINIQNWAMTETNVPVYPEFRVYKTIREKLKKQYPLAGFSFYYY